MKKFWSIILITGMLGMVACSSNDDKTEMPDEIIGTWELQNRAIGKLETSDAAVDAFAREIYDELFEEPGFGETIVFRDNGTGTFDGEPVKFYIDKYNITMEDDEGYKIKCAYTICEDELVLTLNMREIIINEMMDDLDDEEIYYIKKALKQFTIIFTYLK